MVSEYRFHEVRRWRFDFAWPDALVALEIEGGVWSGGRHTNPKGFIADCEKYNTALSMGWSVIRCPAPFITKHKMIYWLKEALAKDSGSP